MLPVGSVTGAPKLAAMAHIARFERERRGLYTGVYGVVTGARVRLAVAIRTLVRDGAGLHYGAGGGIVWDSDPAREWDELVWKQRAWSLALVEMERVLRAGRYLAKGDAAKESAWRAYQAPKAKKAAAKAPAEGTATPVK